MIHKPTLTIAASSHDGERIFTVRGQYARTARALIEAGAKGVTALDVSNTWALRLSHYVFVLRREYWLDIETIWEKHDGASGPGKHGRYILKTPVRIIAGNGDREAA